MGAKRSVKTARKGEFVCVEWWDILVDPAGNPNESRLTQNENYGYLHSSGIDCHGIPIVTLRLDPFDDPDLESRCGFACIPAACITRICRVVKTEEVTLPKQQRKPKEDAPS